MHKEWAENHFEAKEAKKMYEEGERAMKEELKEEEKESMDPYDRPFE